MIESQKSFTIPEAWLRRKTPPVRLVHERFGTVGLCGTSTR